MQLRLFAAALIVLIPSVTKLNAATQSNASYITPQMAQLIQAHQHVLQRMNLPGKDGRPQPFDDARMASLLTEGWQLAGQWAASWLDLHPAPSAKDLENIFVDFTPPPVYPEEYDPKRPELYAMEGTATSIATDAYVVTSAYENFFGTGTFIVISRGADGHFRPQWSVKPLAQQHYHLRDEIGRWAFLNSCAYYCGPLVADKILLLPPSKDGQPRFAIDAYQATNGETAMKQLSVWQWNGVEARNLIIHSYSLSLDEDREIQLIGNLLSIPTKETTESFSDFGCCAEPRGIWILRVTPDKILDIRHHFLQPQILWADRLLASSKAKSPKAANLAAPSVLALLQQTELDADMVNECHVLSQGRKGSFEISFGEGTKLWFAYRLRNGQPYFTKMRIIE